MIDLVNKIITVNLENQHRNAFDLKLFLIFRSLDSLDRSERTVVRKLQAFIRVVRAQSRRRLDMTTAEDLIADAQAIIDLIDPGGVFSFTRHGFRWGNR